MELQEMQSYLESLSNKTDERLRQKKKSRLQKSAYSDFDAHNTKYSTQET